MRTDNGRMPAFAAAARRFLELEQDRLPDLSGVVVLLPHHHAASAFLDAVRAAVANPVFLTPRLITLPTLAAHVSAPDETMSRAERVSLLHKLLRDLGWIAPQALWPMAFELHDLAEELDAAMLRPPTDPDILEAILSAQARRLRARPLSREAELVHRVWQALRQGPAGPMRAYAARIARWAQTYPGRLYHVGLHGLSRLETAFLEQCAQRFEVIGLETEATFPRRIELLRQAWLDDADAPDLRARARACAARWPASPIADAIRVVAATDIESETWVAARWLRQRLAAGQRHIGIVALDRLAARRLRAVLERDDILVHDETGWTFSTASASHVIDRLCALVEDSFYFRDLLDLLKSRYLFVDVPEARRDAQVPAFEAAVHRDSTLRGQASLLRQARAEGLDAVAGMIERLGKACAALSSRALRPLAQWLDVLLTMLDDLGVTRAWREDPVGAQLHDLLRGLRHDLARDATPYTFRQWHAWLDSELDRNTFSAREIDSPIRLTHLNAARLRDFEAVAILGADAAHLPPESSSGPLSDTARQELGLPGRRQARERVRDALMDLLGDTKDILITWQRQKNGEPNSASPWLDILNTLHGLAYGTRLIELADAVPTPVPVSNSEIHGPPAPALEALPTRLSASAWQQLVNCPYRFFARHGLGLGEADEAREEMEKRHYGELLHHILRRFHEQRPVLADQTRDRLRAELAAISDAVFAEAALGDYLVRAWRYRWEARLDDYLDWAVRREVDGYTWQAAETELTRDLPLPSGDAISLYGRLDRIDAGPAGDTIIDYKAQSLQTLRAKAKSPSEDVQLAFYCLLANAGQAEFLSLDDKKVAGVALADPDLIPAEAARLGATMDALRVGATLPAHGAPAVCAWCEMSGLCRHGHWPDTRADDRNQDFSALP